MTSSDKTLADRTYRQLRGDIVNGRLAAGSKLKLEGLAQDYEVGMSPLREALARLMGDLLVVSEGQRGFWVAPLSLDELDDVSRVRALIETEALVHEYGKRRALDGVAFSVKPGEIVALLGPNGGGKTTLFRILCTLLRPTGGRARVLGHDTVAAAEEVRRGIGVVFQAPSLDRKLTAFENLQVWVRAYLRADVQLAHPEAFDVTTNIVL